MKKLLTMLGLVAMTATGMKAQYALTGQTATTSVELVTCGLPDTIQFTLTNTSGATITNDSVHIVLPAGVTLSSVLPGAGYTVTSKGIFIASLANSSAITVRYLLTTNCGASALTTLKPSYVRTNTPAQTLQGIEYLSSLAFPVLQLTAANQDTSGAGQGSVYTRRYTLTNSSADARSYLQSIGFRDILQKGLALVELKIGNTVVTPTISGDTVSYTFSNTELDADSKLNAGQSVIVYEKVRVSNICQLVNTQSSAIRTTWGCSNAFCETKTATATAQKGTFAPDIYYRYLPTSTYQVCSQYDTLNFEYFNRGNATAYNITGSNAKYGGDDKALYSNSIAEVNVSFDGGTTYQNTSTSPRIKNYSRSPWPVSYAQVQAMIANGNYPATPGVIALAVNYTIDSLNPGDTARFQIVMMRLCNKDAADACGTNNQWGANKDYVEANTIRVLESSYKDFCGNNLFDDWAPGGSPAIGATGINASWQITSYNQPTDISAGTNFTASISNSSNYIVVGNNAAASDSSFYYMVEMTLPSAIQPVAGATKADFYHTSTSGGVSHGACDSFNYNAGTGKLKIFFYRNKWEGQRFLRAGSISARLTASCAPGSGSGPSSIAYQGFYSACSSCGLSEASCVYPQPIQIHCPVAEPTGGIFFNNFDYYRTQFGLADYNNDGLPDGTATAIRDSVSDRRFIPGDTMEFVMGGRVYNVTPGQYPYGYAYNTFVKTDSLRDWGDLTHVTSTLYIRDLAAGLTYSMPITPMMTENTAKDSLFFRYNFSQDSIRGKGTIPSTYNFKNNDSIYIITRYRFMDNAEQASLFYALTPFNLSNQLYLSGVANTNPYKVSDTANVESNDQWYGKVEQVFVYAGYRYTSWIYRTVCNTYNDITSIWGMIGGSSAWNYSNFNNEIRPYATFRNVYKKINAGWELDTAAAQGVWLYRAPGYPGGTFVMTQGTHYTYNAATREVNVDMRKVLDDMYAPGFLFDEARHHNINFRIKKCAPTRSNPSDVTERGVDSLNMTYIHPDIALTGTGTQTLSNGFTIVNTGANITNLTDQSSYTWDNEPKINVQAVGSSTIVSKTSTTSATVKLINERYDATFATAAQATWLKIQKRNGSPIAVDSIQDLTTMAWLKPDSVGVFRTEALAVLAERQYRLAISFTGCVDNDSIQVRTSWNCNCATPSDTGVAQGWTTLKFTRQKPQLEIINTVTPNTGVKLCDTVRLSSVVNNAGAGRAYNVKYSFQMPNGGVGITPVAGQYRLYFPANSGTFVNLPAPTHNGTGLYTWDTITKYIANLDTGGMRDFSDTANSKFRVTYKIITSCGFTSGEDLRLFASEACGPPVEDKATLPIKLAVEDKVASNLYSINSNIPATLKGCNNSLSISTVFSNLASSLATTGASDSITMILPKGFDHVSTTPAPKKDTTFDGKVRLKWSVSGVAPGGTRTFNSTLSYVPNKVACGNSVFDLRSTTRFTDTCIIDGSLCSVEINKDRKEIATDVKKPIFTISAATVSSVVNPMNSAQESITVNYTVANSGDTSTSHTMRVYHDANADGMYNVGEPLLTSQPRTATIATGGTHTHSFTFNAAAGTTCPLVLVMDTMTTCMCDARVSRAISSVPFANGGADVSFCSGQSSPLGQVGPGTYLYSWFPGTGVANSSVPFTTVIRTNTSTTIDSVYQYILTTTRTGGGCVTSDTVNVTVKRLPVVTASKDTIICGGSSITLTATGGGTYAWSTIPVKTTASITETPTTGTNYFVTVTGTNGCSRMDTVGVGVLASITANAGPDVTRINCSGDSVQIGTSAVAGHTYVWSPTTGLSSSTTAQPYAKPTVTTTYKMTITNTTTGCTGVDSVKVTVTNSTLFADAGADKAACLNSTPNVSIGGAPSAIGGTLPYSYAWSPSTGLSSTSIANPTKVTTTVGAVDHILVVTDNKGCIARDTVKVTINALPTANAGRDTAVCSGSPAPIGSAAVAGTTYAWSPSTGLANGTASSTTFTSTTAGTYTFTVTATTTATGCTSTDIVVVTVNGLPVADAGADKSRVNCVGDSVQIGTASVAGMTYAWSPATNLSSTTVAQPWAKPTATTTYALTVTQTSTGCKNTDAVVVNVTTSTLTADAGADKTACQNSTPAVSIGGIPTATGGTTPYTYAWTPSASLSSATIGNPTASTATTGITNYALLLTDAKGCIARDTVRVTINALPTANAGIDKSTCAGAPVAIGTTAVAGTTYAWAPSAGLSSTTASNPNYTTSVAGTYSLTVTATITATGCTASDDVMITVNALPVVTITSNNQPLCRGEMKTLTGSPAGGTFSGTGVTGNTFTAPTTPGDYIVKYKFTNANSCTDSTSQTINVKPSPTSNAGSNDTICNGASSLITGVAGGTSPGALTEWYSASVSPATRIATTLSTTVNPILTTNYIFVVTNNGCSTNDTMVVAVIQKPDLVNDMTTCQSAMEDVQATFAISALTANDNNTPVLKGGVSYALIGAKHGTATISGTNILYTASTNYNGKDTVMMEGYSTLCPTLRDTSIFCINVAAVNDNPVAVNDTISPVGNASTTVNLLANDTDVEATLLGGNVTILSGSGPSFGTVSAPTATGSVNFTANASNIAGMDSFKYSVCDTGSPAPGVCDTATVIVYIKPELKDSTAKTTSNPLDTVKLGPSITLTPGTAIKDAYFEGPSHGSGTVSIDPTTGVLSFIPNDTAFVGKDTIMKVVCIQYADLTTYCDTSYMYINNPPLNEVVKDTTPMNTPVTFSALTPIIFSGGIASTAKSPTLTINPDGTVKYTPPTGFVGTDTARIIKCDGSTPMNCDTTTFIVTVTAPASNMNPVSTPSGSPLVVSTPISAFPGSSVNVTPLDPANGTATKNPDGSVTYTSDPNYVGMDTVKTEICITFADGNIDCDTVINVVRVTPAILDTVKSTPMGTPVSISAPIMNLGTGTTISSVGKIGPSNGTAVVNSDGSVTYTPNPNFVGFDTVKRVICIAYPDKTVCDTSVIVIKVDPKVTDTAVSTLNNTPITLGSPVTAGPGTTVDITTTNTGPGTVTTTNGSTTYTPAANYVGFDTIVRVVRVIYPNGDTLYDTSIVVARVYPSTTPTTASTTGTDPSTIGTPFVLGSGTSISDSKVINSPSGKVVLNPDGTFTYTPAIGFSGKDTVVRVICIKYPDGDVKCDTFVTIIDVSATDIAIPNYFSPNGDGINDVWSLDGILAKYPNTKAIIYNRWGNVVWRSTGPYGKSTSGSNIWFGQKEGGSDILPDGVYYYLLEMEDEFKTTKTGFIELMRQ